MVNGKSGVKRSLYLFFVILGHAGLCLETAAATVPRMNERADSVRPIVFADAQLELLDQRVLPHRQETVVCRNAADVAAAITAMVVRGAPAIGMAAAYGLVLAQQRGDDFPAAVALLAQSRPTAVNLRWALERMQAAHAAGADLLVTAQTIEREDRAANYAMGDAGAAHIAAQLAATGAQNRGRAGRAIVYALQHWFLGNGWLRHRPWGVAERP